jgi:hypothetical protein
MFITRIELGRNRISRPTERSSGTSPEILHQGIILCIERHNARVSDVAEMPAYVRTASLQGIKAILPYSEL